MPERMKQAVCLFIQNEEGKILGVARRDDHEKFGLPGGKVDPGESHMQAAIRELREETNIQVKPLDVYPVFTSICHGDDGNNFMCTTYFVERWLGVEEKNGTLSMKENSSNLTMHGDAGPVKWLEPETLLSGPFGKYNLALVMRLKEANIIP